MTKRCTVLGAGSYGTALAICVARKGTPTYLWGRDKQAMAYMAQAQSNTRYLPEITFPAALEPTADLPQAISQADFVLVVVPSDAFSYVLKQIKPYLQPGVGVAWATKGLEPGTGRLLSEVAKEILGPERPLAVLSGPTFAREMALGMPTAISISATDTPFAKQVIQALHCDQSFRVYSNLDFIGIQLGGAVKNVIAIGAGMADGLGFGANTRTALITRGLAELTRLGLALGSQPETFTGMAGLGDLILTCTDNQSRNRRFGLAIGEGKTVEEAMASIGQAVEGYRNTKEAYLLAKKHQVEMPIVEQIYAVLYEGLTPKQAAHNLLSRAQKREGL